MKKWIEVFREVNTKWKSENWRKKCLPKADKVQEMTRRNFISLGNQSSHRCLLSVCHSNYFRLFNSKRQTLWRRQRFMESLTYWNDHQLNIVLGDKFDHTTGIQSKNILIEYHFHDLESLRKPFFFYLDVYNRVQENIE
jgi:hypothetical protein